MEIHMRLFWLLEMFYFMNPPSVCMEDRNPSMELGTLLSLCIITLPTVGKMWIDSMKATTPFPWIGAITCGQKINMKHRWWCWVRASKSQVVPMNGVARKTPSSGGVRREMVYGSNRAQISKRCPSTPSSTEMNFNLGVDTLCLVAHLSLSIIDNNRA